MGKNKRKRGGNDSFRKAYENVVIEARESTGRPCTPHSFFKSSFNVTIIKSNNKQAENESTCNESVVVHQHANGLCIVTVGDALLGNNNNNVKNISFQVEQISSTTSANERRKRQSKLLKGTKINSNQQDITSPNTILAQVTLDSGETINIPAGVWGTVLELNTNITPSLLKNDPLLDGYLAVILPTGSFPPKFRQEDTTADNDRDNDKGQAVKKKKAHAAHKTTTTE